MNHDELLAKIDLNSRNVIDQDTFISPYNTLRAVVELHKSYFGLCKTCTTLNKHIAYPCLTIQTIEKELA